MDRQQKQAFDDYRQEWSQELEIIRQNGLMNEGSFITFTQDRGLPVFGAVTGDPGKFHRRGWLASDGSGKNGEPLFHPFRVYAMHRILKACDLKITKSASLGRESAISLFKMMLSQIPSDEVLTASAAGWNEVIDLAILLEPLYWPKVTGHTVFRGDLTPEEMEARFGRYRQGALDLIRTLDLPSWQFIHEDLRRDAAMIDDNPELYALLRVSKWDQREKLKGSVSGSLWIRHIAEVLRRGFEEAHKTSWPEEFQSFTEWYAHGRELMFGSDRAFDDVLRTRPYAAYNFGLFTGSLVRWYVEGETEYYSIVEILGEAAKLGIEVVNLRGVLATERDNIALKLADWLKEDKALRRFSIISFDLDVSANTRAIQRQVEQANVVGHIAAHKPDFEMANFSIAELVDVAVGIDEADGVSGANLRAVNWGDIDSGAAFQALYRKVSLRKNATLKGEVWGRALANYALAHPTRVDTGQERPLIQAVEVAVRSRIAHYDLEKQYFGFDSRTFEHIRVKPNPPYIAG